MKLQRLHTHDLPRGFRNWRGFNGGQHSFILQDWRSEKNYCGPLREPSQKWTKADVGAARLP